jgi:Flp pilus assembly protein TadG
LPLSFERTTGLQRVQADDTAFATSTQGFILFADKVLNTVFKLSKEAFAPNAVYTAANSGPFVGTLDTNTGVVTPIVTGLGNPGGVVFVDTSRSAGEPDQKHNRNQCNNDQ